MLGGMPYQLLWEKRGLRIHHTGLLTVEDVMSVNEQLFSSERYDMLYYQLIDLLEVDGYAITVEDIRRFGAVENAGALSLKVNKMRIAMVAKDSPEIRQLFAAYVALIKEEDLECRFFDALKPAEVWVQAHAPK